MGKGEKGNRKWGDRKTDSAFFLFEISG